MLFRSVNGVNLRLESGEYRFERDRFAVPFSFVAEHLASGRSENNETSGRLQLQTFNRMAVFEPGAQLITVEGVKGLKQHYVSDVFVEDGEVYVGLRMASEWLGYEVTSFTIGGDEHHVTLQKNIISLPLEV